MKTKHRYPALLVGVAIAILLFGLLPTAVPVRAAGSINVPHTTVPQGTSVAVTGAGFTGQDTTVVYVDAPVGGHGQRIQTSTTTDGNGNFSARLNLPRSVDAGTYTLIAKDTHGVTASQHLTVQALLVLRVNGGPSQTTVVDRRGFFVDALGFQPGETVKIQATYATFDSNNVVETRTPVADASGRVFNVSMFAPAGAKAGWAAISAAGQSSNRVVQGRVYVAYRPYIVLNHKSIQAGSSVAVLGRDFVANSTIRIQIAIFGVGGNSQTLTATTQADNNGAFTRWIRIPGYTSAGTYTVGAVGATAGNKRYAKLTVTRKPAPRATATPTPKPTARPTAQPTPKPTARPVYHATARVLPAVTLPNQTVTLTGHGFPANAAITVSVTVDMRGGGNRYISTTAAADSRGAFTTAFRVPYKAAPGTYTVTAASVSGVQASDRLQVLPRSSHPKNLSFQWVSLWYHTVRQGTWDYVSIQSTLHTQLGIWVHVIFPDGERVDIYTNTNNSGRWGVRFEIPQHGINSHSNQAYVTFQLWHGQQTTQSFLDFNLV